MKRRRRGRHHRGRGASLVRLIIFLIIVLIGIPALLSRGISWPFGSSRDVPLVELWRDDLGKVVSLTLEDYVKGVVAAEMPASFHPEALKAQAVVARTYAYRRIKNQERVPEHPEAHFSTDHTSGQAWISWEEMRERWGLVSYLQYRRKVSQAVDETKGEIAVYKGEPILAVYHSTSGGRTENSENYWSSELPYLRSVADEFGSHSPYQYSTASFSKEEVLRRLNLTDLGEIRVVERFASGRVKTVQVGDMWFSGREIRERLGLRSNWFTVNTSGNQVSFAVWGYGHGVGMPQYGADGMARQGYDYRQILQYYYQGITLQTIY